MADSFHKIVFTKDRSQEVHNALFLDRDGVVNKKPDKHDYVKSWDEFEFNTEIFEILRISQDNDLLVIVVTNQRGIARGMVDRKEFDKITKNMFEALSEEGIPLAAVYFCPHAYKEDCRCRKPNPGLLEQAIKDYRIEVSRSVLIGDSDSDIEAGKAVGVDNLVKVNSNFQDTNLSEVHEIINKSG